jgi:hypothetical protein
LSAFLWAVTAFYNLKIVVLFFERENFIQKFLQIGVQTGVHGSNGRALVPEFNPQYQGERKEKGKVYQKLLLFFHVNIEKIVLFQTQKEGLVSAILLA